MTEHVGIEIDTVCRTELIPRPSATKELLPRVVKAQLPGMLLRHDDLSAANAVVNRGKILLVKVCAIIHTPQIALVVGRRHATRHLRIVQICVEHDDAIR